MIADPYPVIDSRGDLTPIVEITFYGVEERIANLNLDDPQPPGYRYRLPLVSGYDSWVANRDRVVPEKAYKPWNGGIDPLLVTPTQQGISYYEDGLWFHVGGSVFCWCGDPPDSDGDRVFRGGSWYCFASYVRAALRYGNAPGNFDGILGYRLVRGPIA